MKYFVAIALIGVALSSELARAGRLSSHDWQLFKRQHGKSYETDAEDARRFAIFMATKERVERHNAKGDSSFRMGLNHLADWTEEELAKLNGFKLDESALVEARAKLNETEAYLAEILGSSSGSVPDEFDWRKVPRRVTPVKDQGRCQSGWAFASVGVLEGQEAVRIFKKSRKMIDLSEQQLVDCSSANRGCGGGMMARAFDDVQSLGGIVSTKVYPYTAQEGECALNTDKVVMKDFGHVMLPARDENTFVHVLVDYGPISVALHVTSKFLSYKSGILDDDTCSSDVADLNHAALVVGYGSDPKHGDWWIVKNSWGPSWGEQGYIKIRRDVNMCGMANLPTIAKF